MPPDILPTGESSNVSDTDIIAFFRRQATVEQWVRVRNQLNDPTSYANRWVREMRAAMANPFDVGNTWILTDKDVPIDSTGMRRIISPDKGDEKVVENM